MQRDHSEFEELRLESLAFWFRRDGKRDRGIYHREHNNNRGGRKVSYSKFFKTKERKKHP